MAANNYKAYIREVANSFLSKNNLGIPVNLKAVANSIDKVHIIYAKLPEKVNGITIPLKNGDLIILINKIQQITRRRFTLCHEIGHIVLGHYQKERNLASYTNLEGCTITDEEKKIETEANIFASELLIPTNDLKHKVYTLGIFEMDRLCKFYGVSKHAMEIRLKEIGFNRSLKVSEPPIGT